MIVKNTLIKEIIYEHISFPSKVKECVKESPFTRKRPVYRESRRKVKDRKNNKYYWWW